MLLNIAHVNSFLCMYLSIWKHPINTMIVVLKHPINTMIVVLKHTISTMIVVFVV